MELEHGTPARLNQKQIVRMDDDDDDEDGELSWSGGVEWFREDQEY